MSGRPVADPALPGEAEAALRCAAVVVTHQTRDEVMACLGTLPGAGVDEIVVVDSGSTDGTAETVRAAYPDVTVCELPNVGYARAANAGIARTTAPVVIVANADTHFTPLSASRMAHALAGDPTLGAVGPRVVYPDGRPQASARRLPTLRQAVAHAALGLWWPGNPWTRAYRMVETPPGLAVRGDRGRPRDADWLSGCVIALRREAVLDVDGFDPGYFMYVEDVDLGWRLRQAGWRLQQRPEAEVVHAVGASTERARTSMVVAHARSLDRFYGRAYAHGLGRWLRPLVRAGLVAWVVSALAWDRLVRGRTGRSSTGE